jgi:hypothetical protein
MSRRRLERAYEECRQAAIAAGALKPRSAGERMAAHLADWSSSPKAQHRLHLWTVECLKRKGFDVKYFEDFEACRQAAIAAGTLQPQRLSEKLAAFATARGSFADSPVAQQRYNDWITQCMRAKGYDM